MNFNNCVVCQEPVKGRKRRDAQVCIGECARALANARTRAWKQRRPFSVRKGIVPLGVNAVGETVKAVINEEPPPARRVAVAVPVGTGWKWIGR